LFGDPSTFLPEIRCAVFALDRHVPVHDVRTMDQVVATATSRGCLTAMVLGVFGLTAIVLAAVGMYGELRTSSAARVREFALRKALGAKTQRGLAHGAA
jgi:ABC-type antimicrobial peptide transport system permease subunit